jgi:hypothetical protein
MTAGITTAAILTVVMITGVTMIAETAGLAVIIN